MIRELHCPGCPINSRLAYNRQYKLARVACFFQMKFVGGRLILVFDYAYSLCCI